MVCSDALLNCARCGQPLEPGITTCPKCGAPAEPPPPRKATGDTLVSVDVHSMLEGKWRIGKQIGEGGMGTVYLATDVALDREVAVKILAKQLATDQELLTRFEREAKMMAKLEHPNIVPVYAVGRHDDRPFIVMKMLEGQTLSQLLRDKGALSVDETLAMAKQVAAGLQFIHEKGFVHRDIKASNIFIAPDGHATILDFGILRSREGQDNLTRTGMVMGTPQYMSPEQALGVRGVDHRSDLYALAVLAYECLTGTLPFDGDNELSIIQMQAHMPPPDLLQRAPWVPKPLADVVVRALSKRPEDRYPSANELFQALATARDLAADSGPLTAPPASARRPSGEKVQIRPTTPAVPSGMGLAALQAELARSGARPAAPVEPAAVAAVPGPDTAALAKSLRTRRRLPLWVLAGALVLGGGAAAYYALARPNPAPVTTAEPEDAGAPETTPLAIPLVNDAGENVVATPEDVEDESETKPGANHSTGTRPKGERHGNGRITVVTTLRGEPYWASVTVDGVRRGTTPMLLELPSGPHAVRIERLGFKPMSRQVKVAVGRTSVQRFELQQ
jgi:serine/threonine protein kinase